MPVYSNVTIKRSTTTNRPNTLHAGELAYSYPSNTLFIGTANGDGVLTVAGLNVYNNVGGQYSSAETSMEYTDAETKEIDSGRCEMSGISSGRGSRQGAAADSYRNVPQVSTREISMEMFQNEKHREPERVGE